MTVNHVSATIRYIHGNSSTILRKTCFHCDLLSLAKNALWKILGTFWGEGLWIFSLSGMACAFW